jgi:hypothetical protein
MSDSAALEWVNLPSIGRVTLAPIERVRTLRDAERATAGTLADREAAATAAAAGKLAEAGAILLAQRALWPVPADLGGSLRRADELAARLEALDRDEAVLDHGAAEATSWIAQIWAPVSRWWRRRGIRRDRSAADVELRTLAIQVARRASAGDLGSPDSRPVIAQAGSLEAEARKHSGHTLTRPADWPRWTRRSTGGGRRWT